MIVLHSYRFFTVIIFCLITTTVKGFDINTLFNVNQDSLKTKTLNIKYVSELNINSTKAKQLITEAKEKYRDSLFDESTHLFLKASPVFKKEKSYLNLGYIYNEIGSNYEESGNERKALEYYKLSQYTFEKTDSIHENKIYNFTNLANLYSLRGRYGEAQECLNSALKLALAVKSYTKEPITQVYMTMAQVYSFQGDYENAIKILEEAETLAVNIVNNDILIITRLNLLRVYVESKNVEKAYFILTKIPEDSIKNPLSVFVLNNFKADISFQEKKYQEALFYNSNASEIAYKEESIPLILASNYKKAIIKDSLGQTKTAIKILEEALIDSKKYDRLDYSSRVYMELSRLYKKQSNYIKSLNSLDEYVKIKDSLTTIEKNKKTEFLKTMFNVEKSQYELEKKETKIAYLKELQNKQKLYYISLFIGLLAVISLIIVVFKKQKNVLLLEQKNKVSENDRLKEQVEYRNKQILDFSLHIKEKNQLLDNIKTKIQDLNSGESKQKLTLKTIVNSINGDIKSNKEQIELYTKIHNSNVSFLEKVNKEYSSLSAQEIKIIQMLRLDLSSKQIASQMNLSINSVDTYRSRIRKKMEVPKNEKLSDFIKTI